MSVDNNDDIMDLPFYEYNRLATKRHAEKHADVGIRWFTFDELVASSMTEIEIQAHYGEEIAVNVGIARDPEDPYWWSEVGVAKAAIEVDPGLVEAHRRGEIKWPAKGIIELRIDYDILDHFREGGGDWETRLNDTLRKAVFGEATDGKAELGG